MSAGGTPGIKAFVKLGHGELHQLTLISSITISHKEYYRQELMVYHEYKEDLTVGIRTFDKMFLFFVLCCVLILNTFY